MIKNVLTACQNLLLYTDYADDDDDDDQKLFYVYVYVELSVYNHQMMIDRYCYPIIDKNQLKVVEEDLGTDL
jgi:hypothetical protein